MNGAVAILLGLQILVPVLKLGFAGLAVRVARMAQIDADVLAASWLLTALAFTLSGASDLLHGVSAAWAYVAGPGSPIYDTYLRWSPSGMQGRTFAMIAYGVLLSLLPIIWKRSPLGRSGRVYVIVLLLGMAIGTWVGWLEGGFTTEGHWPLKAAFDSLELVVLLVALGVGLMASSIDRLLWACVGVYAFHQAWNVIWFSAMAWFDTPGAWAPNPLYIQMYAALAYAAMIAIALRRLSLARQGRHVPSLLETIDGPRAPMFEVKR